MTPLIFVTFCLVSIPYFENVQDRRWAVSWQVTLCLVTGVEEEMYQDAGDNILHILPDTRTQWHHLTTSSNWSPDLPLGCQQMHLTVCIIAIHSIYSPKPVDNFSVLDIYSHLTFKHVFKHFEALLGYTFNIWQPWERTGKHYCNIYKINCVYISSCFPGDLHK